MTVVSTDFSRSTWFYYYLSSGAVTSSGIRDNYRKLITRQNAPSIKRKRPAQSVIDSRSNDTEWGVSSTVLHQPFFTSVRGDQAFFAPMGLHRLPNDYPSSPEISEGVLINKLRSDFRESSVNLGQMLAEYKQTAKLFGDLLPDVARFTVAAVTRNPKLLFQRRQHWSKQTSADFLKYQYGIKPFMSDAYGSFQALKQAASRSDIYMRKSVRRREAIQGSSKKNSLSLFNNLLVYNSWNGFQTCKIYGIAKYNNSLLSNTLGTYGLTNPLALAWELIPFSFVADWWVNTGEVLASLDNLLYFSDFKTTTVRRRTVFCETTMPIFGGTSTHLYRSYYRGSPVNRPVIASFQYKPDASVTHLLNGLALAAQIGLPFDLFRRKK